MSEPLSAVAQHEKLHLLNACIARGVAGFKAGGPVFAPKMRFRYWCVEMWNGRLTLGEFWATYVGPSDQNSPHAHVAVQLALGIGEDVTVRVGRRRLKARGVLIRPLTTHTVATGLQVALVYVEPQASLGRALVQALGGRLAMPLPPEVVQATSHLDDPVALLSRLAAALGLEPRAALDARLAHALELLERSVGAAGAIADAAHDAGLSTPRLRALASEQLGAPLARWVLWRKLERAGRSLARGASLAEAAADGAFADQAHLARTMRRMFGVTPRVAARVLR